MFFYQKELIQPIEVDKPHARFEYIANPTRQDGHRRLPSTLMTSVPPTPR
jgi:hypothetical protein